MGGLGAALRERPVALATTISALLCGVYLAWQPQVLDLSAQIFRAELWEREGFVVWSEAWYSGFNVPGYSLLYPPLGALLGPELLGALCALGAAALFGAVAFRAYGERAWLGAAWFGAASTVALFGGRITFALGLVFGLGAVWGIQRGRPVLGALAGLGAGLASPVAGLFTALAAGAVLIAGVGRGERVECTEGEEGGAPEPAIGGKRPYMGRFLPTVRGQAAMAVLVAAAVSTLLPSLLFPTDGFQPLGFSAFIPVVLASAAALLLLPRDERVPRIGVALYAVLGLLAFLIDTPLGGNVTRLGATFAGPILALALFGRRPLALALIALPLIWWQWTATVRDVVAAEGDPAVERAYYEPLLDELDRLPSTSGRVHIPPTRNRWEAAYVAPEFSLARGWMRQLESEDIRQFTGDNLTPAVYAQWLYRHGVAYVAVPDAELDYLAEDEVDLIDSGELPFLAEVWSNGNWRLYEVRATDGSEGPEDAALSSGGAQVTFGPEDAVLGEGPRVIRVQVPRPGDYLLNIRYSPYFTVEARGRACIEDAGDASIRLTAEEPTRGVVIEPRFSLGGAFRPDRICSE